MHTNANILGKVSCCNLDEVADPAFFAALAEPQRMRLLARLLNHDAPMTVSDLAKDSPVHMSVVSRHLRQLELAGLVSSTRAGRKVLYEAERTRFSTVLRGIADAVDGEIHAHTGDER